MSNNPVGWFEIYVQDMSRAQAFYEQVLDVELEALEMPDVEMMTFPMSQDAPGSAGALIKMPDMASGGTGTLVYFSSDDCAVEAGRVAAAGGMLLQEKLKIGEYGFIAIMKDPDGNMVGLHSNQ